MSTERILSVANETFQQIFWSIDRAVYWSWGVSKRIATEYKGMPTLALRVSGAIHKGWVYICLNEGADMYEIYLLNVRKREVKHVDEVYCDTLGTTIDGLIERPVSANDDEYFRLAMNDSKRKWNAV